jgi:putative endonuclease
MNIGRYGEGLACTYLERKGYKILKRNFYTRQGEVDIVAEDKDTLVFVEVKTRIGRSAGEPYEAVSRKKLKTIHNVGYLYLHVTNAHYKYLRVDVVSITLSDNLEIEKLDHFENVDL